MNISASLGTSLADLPVHTETQPNMILTKAQQKKVKPAGLLPGLPDTLTREHIISHIQERWRSRQVLHKSEKILTSQMLAYCRRFVEGQDKDKARAFCEEILADQGRSPELVQYYVVLCPLFNARLLAELQRKGLEKQLADLAAKLPIAIWVDTVRGFGIGSLAAVIGEAGDLSNYATHSKLWKRMGLAPVHGKSGSTWRSRGREHLAKHEWEAAGYSPRRRSVVWNIGQCIMKAQSQRVDEAGNVVAEAGYYRRMFDARKELELITCEAIDANPALRMKYESRTKEHYSPKLHANARALRFMEKAILRDLWEEWQKLM